MGNLLKHIDFSGVLKLKDRLDDWHLPSWSPTEEWLYEDKYRQGHRKGFTTEDLGEVGT